MTRNKWSAFLLSAGAIFFTNTTVQAALQSSIFGINSAPSASWQNCNVDGCKSAGSTVVKSDYSKTKYPIVLVHGMSGFSKIGPLEYWNGITEDLTANGANVFVLQQAPFQSSEVRGEQALVQIKQILAITGSEKVNVIGHSHGTQSSRYVGGLIPSKVASVTTVGGPNKGSEFIDVIYAFLTKPGVNSTLTPLASAAINIAFSFVSIGSGHYYDEDFLAGLESNTSAGLVKFNQKFPDGVPTTACGSGSPIVNGVRYYSWSGTKIITNLLDPLDYFMKATSFFMPKENDGLVSRCSSHLGVVVRDNYDFNHFDEVNQLVGLVGAFQNPVSVFKQHANRLKNTGL